MMCVFGKLSTRRSQRQRRRNCSCGRVVGLCVVLRGLRYGREGGRARLHLVYSAIFSSRDRGVVGFDCLFDIVLVSGEGADEAANERGGRMLMSPVSRPLLIDPVAVYKYGSSLCRYAV